jgi:hypothetical protein
MSFDVLLGLFVQYGYGIVFAAILLDNADPGRTPAPALRRPESLHDGYRAGSIVLLSVVGVGVGVYVLIKLLRRWRHGPASFRDGLVARVVDALRRPRRQACATSLPDRTAYDASGRQLANACALGPRKHAHHDRDVGG